jgi:hypothetical protein
MKPDGKASHSKTAFRMEYAVSINVRSTTQRIWVMLTNAANFPRWNSTIQSIEGQIAAGQKIKLRATIAPERVFNLNIREFVPEQRLVWSDGMAPMFTGVRTFTLTPKPDQTTDFHMAEVFSGLMLPLIAGSLPNFGPVFERYAADLKAEAERSS